GLVRCHPVQRVAVVSGIGRVLQEGGGRVGGCHAGERDIRGQFRNGSLVASAQPGGDSEAASTSATPSYAAWGGGMTTSRFFRRVELRAVWTVGVISKLLMRAQAYSSRMRGWSS